MTTMQMTGPALLASDTSHEEWQTPARATEARSDLDPEVVERAEKQRAQIGVHSQQRTALLGIVMANLVAVDFETAAELLAVKPKRLLKFLHGEAQIPSTFDRSWTDVAEILTNVRTVLHDEYVRSWLTTPAPDLDGRSPLVAVSRGDRYRVLEITRCFLRPSFG